MQYVPAVAVLIAAVVALIGYFQWQTAHHRIVLDLFDRRFDTYESFRNIVTQHLTWGEITNEMLLDYVRNTSRARFLFGPEVVQYLENSYRSLVQVKYSEYSRHTPEAKREPEEERVSLLFERLSSFYTETDALFGPYMRLQQKTLRFWRPL
jgi:hypothetical protein